ncbi:hypothetical protein H5T87_08395 [bacterium]|nr:hypothetical protein [bacterium]
MRILFLAFIILPMAMSVPQVKIKNLKLDYHNMQLRVLGGELVVAGKSIKLKPKEFIIEPPTIVSVENELLKIGDEKPEGWWSGTRLPGCKTELLYHCLPGCLVPHSVVVKSADGSIVYEEGKDYLVDHTWGAIGRIPQGRIPPNSEVAVSYKYSLQRIDLLQANSRGDLFLKKGKEEKTCPLPPRPDKGYYPVVNIYLPYRTSNLSDELIYTIGPAYPQPTKAQLRANSRFVRKTLEKLKRGEKVKIVFWGDSVTAGGDASSPDKAFPAKFVKLLGERFPKAKIEMVNAGIGGSNTNQRLPNIQSEVLDHKPDLVIIEFVNDMGFDENNLRRNYYQAIDLIRAHGGEVIILTPHFTMPSMMGLSSVKYAKETRPAVEILRKIAKEKDVGLADASRRWEHLAKEGIPYTTLLYNGINHPDDRGHQIFVEELLKFFPSD